MTTKFEEILALLNDYEKTIISDEELMELIDIEQPLKEYFGSNESEEEKQSGANMIRQKLESIVDLLESRKQGVEQRAKQQQNAWNMHKKYLKILNLQDEELWNS
ncbi:MAG: hypothetical protein K0Q51_1351 [Rickettsiaceae bacterium]|jgi:hypothetical protein|nr:hypothetical protein [Rickettsiaceae bacterium]